MLHQGGYVTYTDEETASHELALGVASSSEECWNCADDQSTCEGPTWPKAITRWPTDQSNEQGGTQRYDVGIGDVGF